MSETELELTGQIYNPIGLQDGGHHIIECSNCGAPLIDIHVTQPDLDYRWKMKAKCCHCGDKSFVVKVIGGIHLGSTDYTIPGPYELVEENGISYILIETEKVKDYESKV